MNYSDLHGIYYKAPLVLINLYYPNIKEANKLPMFMEVN